MNEISNNESKKNLKQTLKDKRFLIIVLIIIIVVCSLVFSYLFLLPKYQEKQILSAYESEDFETVIKKGKDFLTDEEDGKIIEAVIYSFYKLEREDEGLAYYDKFAKKDPITVATPIIQGTIGNIYFRKNEHNKAGEYYERAFSYPTIRGEYLKNTYGNYLNIVLNEKDFERFDELLKVGRTLFNQEAFQKQEESSNEQKAEIERIRLEEEKRQQEEEQRKTELAKNKEPRILYGETNAANQNDYDLSEEWDHFEVKREYVQKIVNQYSRGDTHYYITDITVEEPPLMYGFFSTEQHVDIEMSFIEFSYTFAVDGDSYFHPSPEDDTFWVSYDDSKVYHQFFDEAEDATKLTDIVTGEKIWLVWPD